MAALLYRCPFTLQYVQGWTADDGDDRDVFQPVKCLACQREHLVNAATGKVLGALEDE